MAKTKIIIDCKNCISCSICVQACPVSALELSLFGKSGKYPNMFPEVMSDKCIGCGICVKNCPMDCISQTEE
ncbi:MAG: 4Fe-4S dicluster domain-containing protein [Lachnospiraceae bacterium]|nr:4Fe-4S dicluster domain-containing protein [Lachnospiraceae bacterium]